MDINYLKEFSVLAETKNYWEAAYRLYLNQSTLSKHIKAMEQELGVPLFARTTRKVELTEFGIALLPYAQAAAKLEFDYSAKLMLLKDHQKGLITIGSIPAMAQYRITDILLEYQKLQPDNSVRVIEDDPKVLMEQLLDKRCELLFLREAKNSYLHSVSGEAHLERIPYLTDHMVAVLPKDHPLAGKEELTLRDLKDEKFAFIKENTMMYDLCCSACQEAGFIPSIIFNSHRLDSILDMVTKGGCAALLMDRHTQFPLNSALDNDPPFHAIRITPAVTTQVSLCYRKGDTLSPAAAGFVEFFRKYISDPLI